VNKFREYVVAVCESSRINLIFGLDATLGDYPDRSQHSLTLIVRNLRLPCGR
jgi:hypothetical protein